MRVLVVGSAGFIGTHTCAALREAGHEVLEYDKLEMGTERPFTFYLMDSEAVIYLPATMGFHKEVNRYWETCQNTAYMYEVLANQARHVRKVVLASSQAVYGESYNEKDWAFDETHETEPESPYGLSKLHQEQLALHLGKQFNIPTVALRYSIVIGPGQAHGGAYVGALRSFALAYLHGQSPVIFEDGEQLRDYVRVQDVARANVHALDLEGVYNVGGPRPITVNELCDMVRSFTCEKGEGPAPLRPGLARVGDSRHVVSDSSKLRATGWEWEYPPDNREGVWSYLEWLKKQNWEKIPYDAPLQANLDDMAERGMLVPWQSSTSSTP